MTGVQTCALPISLVELEYEYSPGGRVLPCLRLPRLKKLRLTSSLEPGQVQKLADILPYDGRALLAGTTKMIYRSRERSLDIELSGNGVGVSLTVFHAKDDHPSVDWFTDQTCIQFDRIEELRVEGGSLVNFPVNLSAFENLEAVQITSWGEQLTERFLRLLYPDPATGVPCRSLREIERTRFGP